jgi:RNA polymerase sigma-70 factor (family 1)
VEKLINSDAEALSSLLQGKEGGLNYLYRAYHRALTHFATQILTDTDTAEDLVEDAFIKLWERRAVLTITGSIRAYLYTTVRNASIDHLRREKLKVGYVKEIQATVEKEEPPVVHRIIEAETLRQVYASMQTLPPKCGQVFRMFYLEEKSLNEIASELNLSLSTVKSQKGRAVRLLRQKLSHLSSVFFSLLLFIQVHLYTM